MLVVWEPVLVTDLQPPSNRELQRVSDPRAQQFWDKSALVSRAISGPIIARGQDEQKQRYRTSRGRLWDTVVVYVAGASWDGDVPSPVYTGGPVVNIAADLTEALKQSISRPTRAQSRFP